MTKKQLINRKKISIIAPVYNEELLIEKFIHRVEDVISKNKKIYELLNQGFSATDEEIESFVCKRANTND